MGDFLDDLFDIDGDGQVTDQDFIDDLAIFHMMQNDKSDGHNEQDDFDEADIDTMAEDEFEE